MIKKYILSIGVLFFLTQCATVPITGRRQVKLLPTSQMMNLSFSQYEEAKKSAPLLPDTDPRTKMVKEVGGKISAAVNSFLAENGYKDRLPEFEWEFNLADENIVNAWCMPGGKVMFYTGILPICDGEEGVAVVMGHEIAHAIARHGNERMSQGMIAQGVGTGLGLYLSQKPEAAQQLFMAAYGAGAQVGMLKFSRDNESEADKLGLVFMTMAGYNPEEAVNFWGRMAAKKGAAGAPPEFLSTHPSDQRRIEDIRGYIPEARKIAAK